MYKLLSLFTLALILTSCEEKRTISYYKKHDKERAEKISQCEDDMGGARHDDNCFNAIKAEQKIKIETEGCHMSRVSGNPELIAKYCKGEY